jgi:hypothetical protein
MYTFVLISSAPKADVYQWNHEDVREVVIDIFRILIIFFADQIEIPPRIMGRDWLHTIPNSSRISLERP